MHVNCSVCFGTTKSCLESEPSGVEGERVVYPTMELCSVAQLSPTRPALVTKSVMHSSIQAACTHPPISVHYNNFRPSKIRALDFLNPCARFPMPPASTCPKHNRRPPRRGASWRPLPTFALP